MPKKRVSSRIVFHKPSKSHRIVVADPDTPTMHVSLSGSGTTHSGDSPADLAELVSTPELVEGSSFDQEVLDALAEVDANIAQRKEDEFRAIIRELVKQQ